MGNVCVCYVECSSSSWQRLFGEITFYRKSGITNDKASVRCVTEADHRSNRDSRSGQEDGVPKTCSQQAAADPRGSRTCVCANTIGSRVAPAGEEGRITVQSAWQVPPVRRKEGRPGCPQGKVVATWYGDDSPHQSWNAAK